MKYAMGVSASIIVSAGLLAAQFLNMPVEIPAVDHAFGEADLIRMRDSEIQSKRDMRDAEDVGRVWRTCTVTPIQPISVARIARIEQLSPRIVAATIVVESSCQSSVVSKDGAVGLMQVDRHTWKQYTREELMQPDRNIEIGAHILGRQYSTDRQHQRRFEKDILA